MPDMATWWLHHTIRKNALRHFKTQCINYINFSGADDQNRTGDLLITNQLLYRLSYIGVHQEFWYLYDGM